MPVCRQTDRSIDRQTDRQIDRQTDRWLDLSMVFAIEVCAQTMQWYVFTYLRVIRCTHREPCQSHVGKALALANVTWKRPWTASTGRKPSESSVPRYRVFRVSALVELVKVGFIAAVQARLGVARMPLLLLSMGL